ncbi:MAG: hypothetical protein RIS70_2832 [Planctomycetota bacterium]
MSTSTSIPATESTRTDSPRPIEPPRVTHERSISLKFLFVSLAVMAAVAAATYGIHTWQVARTSGIFLTMASKHEQESEWEQAVKNLKMYLQLHPDAGVQRVRLAKDYLKLAKTPDEKMVAIKLLRQALAKSDEENKADLRRRLANELLELGFFVESANEARGVLDKSPKDAESLRTYALAIFRQYQAGQLKNEKLGEIGLIDALAVARDANPTDIDLPSVLAIAYRIPELATSDMAQFSKQTIADRANAIIDKMVADNPTNFKAYLSRYSYRTMFGIKGADEDLEQALRIAPDDLATLSTAASAAQRSAERMRALDKKSEAAVEEYQKALGFLRKIVALNLAPQDPGPTIAIGTILVALGLHDEAETLWKQGLEQYPDRSLLFYANLADRRLEARDFSSTTESYLKAIDTEMERRSQRTVGPARLALQRDQLLRRARWELGHGDATQAVTMLQEALNRQAQLGGDTAQSAKAWLLLGAAYNAMGEHLKAGQAYDRAAALRPYAAEIHLAASDAWLNANRPAFAVERAERGVRIADNSNAWFTLANALLREQLRVPSKNRSWTRFQQAIAKSVEKIDDGSLAQPYRAAMIQAQATAALGDDASREKAAEILRAAEDKYATEPGFWSAAALTYEQIKLASDADRAIERMRKLPGSEANVTYVESQLLRARNEHDDADKRLLAALQTAPEADRPSLRQSLIKSKLEQRDFVTARSLLEEQLVQIPRDLAAMRLIADLDLQANKLEEVRRWEERMKTCGSQGEPLAIFFQVRRIMAESAKPTEAQMLEALAACDKLLALRPTWAEAAALRGFVLQRRGKINDAIRDYESAIELGDTRLVIFEELLGLLYRANRLQDVEKYMAMLKATEAGESLVAKSQNFTVFESEIELRNDQLTDALATARRGVENRPDAASSRAWLGRMLMLNDKRDEAEAELLKAVELEPEQLQYWSGLFGFYVSENNVPRAEEVLRQMAALPGVPEEERPFVLAQGYELMGNKEKATEHYDKAAQQAPENPRVLLGRALMYLKTRPDIARECLEKALRLDPKSVPVRQNLAGMLAATGREDDWQRVEQLLTSADGTTEITVDNQRLRAMLLTRKGGAENLLRAEEIVSAIITERGNQVPEDHLILAQIYESLAKLAQSASESDASPSNALPNSEQEYLALCRGQFVTLCARAEPMPQHLLAFIYHWQRYERNDEMREWLDRLETVVNANKQATPMLIGEYIRLRIKLGDFDKAETQLKRFEQVAPESLTTVALRARLLDAQDRKEDAEKLIVQKTGSLLRQAKTDYQRDLMRTGVAMLYAMLDDIGNPDLLLRELEAQSPRAYLKLSHALARHERFVDAIDLCEQLRKIDPSPNAAMIAASILGSYKVSEEESARVEKLFEESLEKFPDNARLLSVIGTYRITQGRHQEALPLLRKAVALEKRNAIALNNLAMLLAEDPQHLGEALRMVDEAIMLAGRVPALYDTKGTVLLLAGRPQEAIDFLKEAVGEGEDDPRFRLHLARAYQKLNALDQARIEFDQAKKRDLEKQVLTESERQMLAELQAALAL